MINTASSSSTLIVSTHSFAEVIENTITRQKSLHAIIPIKKDELLINFSAGQVFTTPNYLTVQTGVNKHITLLPQFLQYSNHSCNPNIFFDTTTMEVIALKDIEPSEELCFFYPSTELDMAQPFICYCGSKGCLQNIKGAKHIPSDVIAKYKLTDFIKEQLHYSL
ncbi:MAG: SET domain-containing protein-lysine N-methyltransferase [Ferruginibacter sp.]